MDTMHLHRACAQAGVGGTVMYVPGQITYTVDTDEEGGWILKTTEGLQRESISAGITQFSQLGWEVVTAGANSNMSKPNRQRRFEAQGNEIHCISTTFPDGDTVVATCINPNWAGHLATLLEAWEQRQ